MSPGATHHRWFFKIGPFNCPRIYKAYLPKSDHDLGLLLLVIAGQPCCTLTERGNFYNTLRPFLFHCDWQSSTLPGSSLKPQVSISCLMTPIRTQTNHAMQVSCSISSRWWDRVVESKVPLSFACWSGIAWDGTCFVWLACALLFCILPRPP